MVPSLQTLNIIKINGPPYNVYNIIYNYINVSYVKLR